MISRWPDFSNATLADAAPILALEAAVQERRAAALGGDDGLLVDHTPISPSAVPAMPAWPSVARLERIRSDLLDLAPKFVNADGEETLYDYDAWAIFPKRFTPRDLFDGDHSLALLPPPGAPDGDPRTDGVYRTFLANCAWWLDRFRYVDAAPHSRYTRRSSVRADRLIDGDGSISGDDPTAAYAADPSHADLSGDVSPTTAYAKWLYVLHAADKGKSDLWRKVGDDWQWVYDYGGEWESETLRAELLSGLIVRNRASLAARALLYLCYDPDPNFPRPSDEREDVSVTGTYDDGDLAFRSASETESRTELYESDWQETVSVAWTGSGASSAVAGTVRRKETRWSERGDRSYVATDETEAETRRVLMTRDECTTSIVSADTPPGNLAPLFEGYDDYGVPEGGEDPVRIVLQIGHPADRGTIPARGSAVVLPEMKRFPSIGSAWDLSQFDRRTGFHPCDVSFFRAIRSINLRLRPILDFFDSYQNGADEWRQPA